eukprot:gb/GEZN01012682.1/.p1 GENE.gb/GEZN01012682.1/~~gb/GEZN01012682.1/.p1  ORF type:complete len:246 (+),score=37.44 gb/GEZN01012682.1/:253-990(+)
MSADPTQTEAEPVAADGSQTKAKAKASKREKQPLSAKKMEKFQQAAEKRGVLYLARVPPNMTPQKVRHLLGQYGTILRAYFTPEDQAIRRRRKKHTGSKAKRFVDGWLEFEDKRIAKRVARALNNTAIGGKKRSFYCEDMWNLKYLRKFKWTHLTEKIAYEKQMRDTRIRKEMTQASKESTFYLSRVEQALAIENMEHRKKKRAEEKGEIHTEPPRKKRRFKQRALVNTSTGDSLRTNNITPTQS